MRYFKNAVRIVCLQRIHDNDDAMQAETSYNSRLAEALEQRRTHLETTAIPQLKQECRVFYSSFHALLQVLEKKGLVQPDPYKQDERISDITLPSEEVFLESERDAQMSIRLSQYDNQLDFLVSYFQFDLEFMNLSRIKKLVGLIKYIRWHQLGETSTHLMTRSLAEYIGRLIRDQDPLSSGIVKDSQDQLKRRSRTILGALKETAGYQRESTKLRVRTEVLPHCSLEPARAIADREGTLRKLRKAWVQTQPGSPFFSDLAWEVIEEEFSPHGTHLRCELLERVQVSQPQQKSRRDPSEEFRTMLLETVRNLATTGGTLSSLLERSVENAELLQARRVSVMQRFKRWIDQLTNQTLDRTIMRIEIMEENTSAVRSQELDFEQFSEAVRKRIRLYGAILNRVSTPARRLQQAGEEQLFSFLQKQVKELFELHRQLSAIDTYIRSEITREQRNRLRPVNVELSTLKEHLLRVNKKRHAYVTRKEEQEQLQKLGIEPTGA